jgi:hypothetical protein
VSRIVKVILIYLSHEIIVLLLLPFEDRNDYIYLRV